MLSIDETEIKAILLFFWKWTYSESWYIWLIFQIYANFYVQSDIFLWKNKTTYSWKAVFSSKPGISSKVYLMLIFIIKLYKEILERENDILKVSYLPTLSYNFLPFLVLLSQYKELNFDVLDILRIRQLLNC